MGTISLRDIARHHFKLSGRVSVLNHITRTPEAAGDPSLKTTLQRFYWSQYVPDVLDAFAKISRYGTKIAVWKGDGFPAASGYTRLAHVHFQGIQRTRKGPYLLVTGSSGHLFVAKLLSCDLKTSTLGSNLFSSSTPPTSDRVVKIIDLNQRLRQEFGIGQDRKHLGGFQILGDYLVVGMEEDGRSEVVFCDIRDPENPRLLHRISRPNRPAGAVGLAKMPQDGHFLVLVGRRDSNILDFYRSTTTDLEDTDFNFIDAWREEQLRGMDQEFGNYQGINLITQRDGTLFFIGLHNNRIGGFGRDYADLFQLQIDRRHRIAITKIANKHMICRDGGNFDAGAGICFDGLQGLLVYTVDFGLTDNQLIRINEFHALPPEATG